MVRNEWMSDFYGQDWFEFDSSSHDINDNGIYEWRVDCQDSQRLALAQRMGFELVETAISYETKLVPRIEIFKDIRLAHHEDLDRILEITHDCFTNNPNFYNRFKNRRFFTEVHAQRYYELSVVNHFHSHDSFTSVYEENGKIFGYFLLKKVGEDLYKGIMTGVDMEKRGMRLHGRMQNFIYSYISKPLTVINGTQIGNRNVLNSHLREGRLISKIEYIFLAFGKDIKILPDELVNI